MYINSKKKSFWIYHHQNRIELHQQKIASLSRQLICSCSQYKSALRIGKQIAQRKNISFQEQFCPLLSAKFGMRK